ncbi:MAG: hypothetical protein ISS47_04710 [Candidatus Omnitrophica bacterium]|nr:hypothetical protein [Candidatus Omnitrophota bacterium]
MHSTELLSRYNKILRIRINHSYAGFFAYVTFALNQLRYCEENNYFPVVYFGPLSEDGPNAFYDERYGDNSWDYYFEPVGGISFDEIRRRIRDPKDPLSRENITELTTNNLWNLHAYNSKSIYNYPYGHYKDVHLGDMDTWYEQQRSKARYYLSKYVRPKEYILAKVEDFWAQHLEGFNILGIHMRGSDKGTQDSTPRLMRIVTPQEYFPHIDRFVRKSPNCRIFLATEQSQFVEEVRARYGDRVILRDVIRTSKFGRGTCPFLSNKNDSYLKGEEVLIDCLLLAKSDFLLRCTSAVGEYAMYFNKNLKCLDLNRV